MQQQAFIQRSGLSQRVAARSVATCRVAQLSPQRSRTSLRCLCSDAAAVQEQTAASTSKPKSTVPTSDVIELDFCSRPLLDERGKKVWELLVCSPDRSFEYAQYFPNSKINSVEVSTRRGLRIQPLCDVIIPMRSVPEAFSPSQGHLSTCKRVDKLAAPGSLSPTCMRKANVKMTSSLPSKHARLSRSSRCCV